MLVFEGAEPVKSLVQGWVKHLDIRGVAFTLFYLPTLN
jgi:hypothetical protein